MWQTLDYNFLGFDERILTEIWVRDLSRRRASSKETFSRMFELNLDDLNISALLFQRFS